MSEEQRTLRLVPIDKELFVRNTLIGFRVYRLHPRFPLVATGEDFIPFFEAPHIWTEMDRERLDREDVTQLFVAASDFPAWRAYVKEVRTAGRETPQLRVQRIEDIGIKLMHVCRAEVCAPELIAEMEVFSKSVVEALKISLPAIRFIRGLIDSRAYTYHHSAGVSMLAPAIALQLGETDERVLLEYALGGLLHDVGKLEIHENILTKPDALSKEEWEIMRLHTVTGADRLQALKGVPERVLNMVLYHHEKLDGSGYPKGLKKGDIPQEALICAVADIFNALSTTRSYQKKRTHFEALMFMKHEMGGKLWRQALDALVLALVEEGGKVRKTS